MNDPLLIELQRCVPESLKSESEKILEQLSLALNEEQCQSLLHCFIESPQLPLQLIRACMASRYLLDSVCRDTDLLFHWLLIDAPYTPLTASRVVDMVELFCCDCEQVSDLDRELRRLRRRVMLAIIWRDVNDLADFAEVCAVMSALAEAAVQQVLNFHYHRLSQQHGVPIGKVSGLPQPMAVLGMGKLGGSELNVSSDIDLMFVFPEAGSTQHETASIDNQQFFTRLGQALIKSLQAVTADGFVFRVDMRLRPYGQSGALVSNFDAFENYYFTQGREWERFAAIKARVIACSALPDSAQSLAQYHHCVDGVDGILQPFAYRRYTDYSVLESLRQLKAMIVQEVQRNGMEANVKLGAGGIREIEFIVQTFQLVGGGNHSALRVRHCLSVLEQLKTLGLLDDMVVEALQQSYIFLRQVEHRIQYFQDQQTQQLPVNEVMRESLAWSMNYPSWSEFSEALDRHRAYVSEQFALVIADPEAKSSVVDDGKNWGSIWDETIAADQQMSLLSSYQSPQSVLDHLSQFRDSWNVERLSESSRESLDALVPQLLGVATQMERPDLVIERLLLWLSKVVGRSSYITLLLENPVALRPLAVLFQGSVWIVELLGQMPALLNELLDVERLYYLPSKDALRNELHLRLLRTDPDDAEDVLEVLRYFKLTHSLRVAASDLAEAIPLMKVSDYLTWIAEVVLEQVVHLAWRQLSVRYGVPAGGDYSSEGRLGDLSEITDFLIVGYGKLGGIELSYSSDLDLVFIYNGEQQGMTDGEQSIDSQTFFTRLGQKIIHILNTRSLAGPLYKVDMRLRPSGNSGMLVSSLNAFTRYQLNDAWTWEHQALIRSRPIVGDPSLAESFIGVRKQVISQQRNSDDLKAAVIEMREKMRNHLGSSTAKSKKTAETPLFHLKQDAGGIVDIEFMVQYAVLAWAHAHPQFVDYTDNVRLLASLQSSGCIAGADADVLTDIYTSYREVTHRLALQKQSVLLTQEQYDEQFATYELRRRHRQVLLLWQTWFDLDGVA